MPAPPKGQHAHACAPTGHWQTITMMAALRLDGRTACMPLEGATDAESFRVYVEAILLPTLQPGDLVVRDNLSHIRAIPRWP